MSQHEICIRYAYERFRFKNFEADVVIGAAVQEDGVQITVKGQEIEGHPRRGVCYRMAGDWRDYRAKSGVVERQFHFASLVPTEPTDIRSIASYLNECPSLTVATVRKLVKIYGADVLRKIREEPEVMFGELKEHFPISPISLERLKQASEFLKLHKGFEESLVEVTGLLEGKSFPRRLPMTIVERWKSRAGLMIRRNPYLLMSFRGVGFVKADRLWRDLGLPPSKLKRQAYCLLHAMSSDTSGDTWFPESFLKVAIKSQCPEPKLEAALELLKRAKRIATVVTNKGSVDWFGGNERWYATRQDFRCEMGLAHELARLQTAEKEWPDVSTIADLDESQREALSIATSWPVGIFGGGPGTGKTFSVSRLVKLICDQNPKASIEVVTPTGKAAVRATEQMYANDVHLKARTIYQALGPGVDENGEWTFEAGPDNPIAAKWVIVDETSMRTTWLLMMLLRALKLGTHVLFVGDVNQLQPVGRGAPLRDMIDGGIAYGELKAPRRNSGAIVDACHAIKENLQFNWGGNLIHYSNAGNDEEQANKLVELITELRLQWVEMGEIQVIVATNDGASGRKALNKRLQEYYNSNESVKGWNFRPTDRVICLKNGLYECDLVGTDASEVIYNPDSPPKVRVANGDMGVVLSIEKAWMWVQLNAPERRVKVFSSATISAGEEEPKWDLAYAVTCHKMQGSQARVCIVLGDATGRAYRLCNREWWYTAFSRPTERLYYIGPESEIYAGMKRSGIRARKTFLASMLECVLAGRIWA